MMRLLQYTWQHDQFETELKSKSNPIAFLCVHYQLDVEFGYKFADAVLRELVAMQKFEGNDASEYMQVLWKEHFPLIDHVNSFLEKLPVSDLMKRQMLRHFYLIIAHHRNINERVVALAVGGR